MMLAISHGFRPKPATQCYYVTWNKVKSNHIRMFWQLIALGEPMRKNMGLLQWLLPLKTRVFPGSLVRPQSPCPVHISTREHVCRKNLMRPGGSFINISVPHVLLQLAKPFHMLSWNVKISTKASQKTSNFGWPQTGVHP